MSETYCAWLQGDADVSVDCVSSVHPCDVYAIDQVLTGTELQRHCVSSGELLHRLHARQAATVGTSVCGATDILFSSVEVVPTTSHGVTSVMFEGGTVLPSDPCRVPGSLPSGTNMATDVHASGDRHVGARVFPAYSQSGQVGCDVTASSSSECEACS